MKHESDYRTANAIALLGYAISLETAPRGMRRSSDRTGAVECTRGVPVRRPDASFHRRRGDRNAA